MSSSGTQTDAMRGTSVGVEAWAETVVIPTYRAIPADRNPMFLEKRVYQGSSGRVYPLPFVDRVSHEKVDQTYQGLHIENEFVYLMVLPEIGGRIHIGYDKKAAYNFFYRQDVIKPALVGLAGPWISGGVEFNWPQHHRPSTAMPCEWYIEESCDGSKTIWLSEHEPMNRMKGMHGICLRPNSPLIELKVRLYNRTPHLQTFLWWANVCAEVHEHYQSFFPPDVHCVADHAKRATATFPGVKGDYYGVRYGERAISGVPASEIPRLFRPQAHVRPDRLDWYSNIPVPTSYMVVATRFDFFGGYDHRAGAGFVHVADRHISPGKKQWTWGNHEFGYAWDRNLSETGAPYVELMAGVYTDNQPDFSYLGPHETKTFSQFWYPIRQIGPPIAANTQLALSAVRMGSGIVIGVQTTRVIADAVLEVTHEGQILKSFEAIRMEPSCPAVFEVPCTHDRVSIHIFEGDDEIIGVEFASDSATPSEVAEPPDPAKEPPEPADVATNDELYVIGVHLEQYRHATRSPESYWQEAVRRDPGDARCHQALGRWRVRRGEFLLAESHYKAALSRSKSRNPNPPEGEAEYHLGLALEYQGRFTEAYAAYAKSAWNYGIKGAAFFAMARLMARRGRLTRALEHLDQARLTLGDGNAVFHLKAAILRKTGNHRQALEVAEGVLAYDSLDHGALHMASLLAPRYGVRFRDAMRGDVQNYLDLAFDYLSASLIEEAVDVLQAAPRHMIVSYALASLGEEGDDPGSTDGSCFANRLEEMILLQDAIARRPNDSIAAYHLGNFLYDRRRYSEAIELWEKSVAIEPDNSIAWRNLGIAYHNVSRDSGRAREAYDRALVADPSDARILFERDQLLKRIGVIPAKRLSELEGHLDLIELRDDLTLEYCALLNATGQQERSRDILLIRRFSPWEGGEGMALAQHCRTYLLLAKKAIRSQDPAEAVRLLQTALSAPENLGEARHLLANVSDLWVALGDAYHANGQIDEARHTWLRAAEFRGDFQEMSVRTYSEMTYYRALALKRLGRGDEAMLLLQGLAGYAQDLMYRPAKIDYFATSLPSMLLFEDDLQARQETTALFLAAQASLGLEDRSDARRILSSIIARDPNHSQAQDLLSECE